MSEKHPGGRPKKLTQEMVDLIHLLSDGGSSIKDICRVVSLGYATVQRVVAAHKKSPSAPKEPVVEAPPTKKPHKYFPIDPAMANRPRKPYIPTAAKEPLPVRPTTTDLLRKYSEKVE